MRFPAKQLFYAISLICFLLGATNSYGLEQSNVFQLKTESADKITFDCSIPEFEEISTDLPQNANEFDGAGKAGVPGKPFFPSWSRWIKIPDGKKAYLKYKIKRSDSFSENSLTTFPHLSFDDPATTGTSDFELGKQTLDIEDFGDPVTLSEAIKIAGVRYAILDIVPLYKDSNGETKLVRDVSVEVQFNDGNIREETFQNKSSLPPVYSEIHRYLNQDLPDRDDVGERCNNLGHYVIVVRNDEAIDAMQDFITWKKRKGHPVSIANLDDIGRNREDLQDWLEEARQEWENPPTYVVLAGDVSGSLSLPYYDDGQMERVSWHASDNQFVCWEGENGLDLWTPEGFIGRLSVENRASLEQVVTKIVGYESDPYIEEDWVEGAVLIADGVHSCITTNQAIRELMQGVGYSRDNIYEAYGEYHHNQHPDVNIVRNGVTRGVGFVNFRGYQTWGNINWEMIRDYGNGWKTPVVTGMVCGSGDYTNSWGDTRPECRSEAWLRSWHNGPRGGVAGFGPTDLHTHTWFNNTIDAEFYDALLYNDVRTLGALCVASKLGLYRNYPSSRRLGDGNTVGYYFYAYNLIGDPGMQVWSAQPEPITADFSDELSVGSTLINLAVSYENDDPVEGAYVHIYRETQDGDIRYGGFADQHGRLSLVVDPLQAGEFLLTITGKNCVPILESFEVAELQTYASISDVIVNDDDEGESDGNGDELINPGETVELSIELTNTGTERSEAFNANLRSNTQGVEIVNGEVEYPEIESGESANGDALFLVRFSPRLPDDLELDFQLRIVYGDDIWLEGFNLVSRGYNFSLEEAEFLNDEFHPNSSDDLVVTLQNTGGINAEPLTGTLYCTNPKIQIRAAETRFDPIARGESESNHQLPFSIYAAHDSYPGELIDFGLLLSDDHGCGDSLAFSLRLSGILETAPQGPTEYGYWAFDSRDTTNSMNPEFNWIDGQNNLNLVDNNDGGNMNWAGTHGQSRTIDLPFEFVYYGERFEEITISSNGWAAFGRSDQVSWNNQEIGSPLAPPAMLCPYWTDLWNGRTLTYYDEDEEIFVIEWRDCIDRVGSHTFAIHLHEPNAFPTATGDGEIVFLYDEGRVFNGPDRDYPQEAVTIGFSSPDRTDNMTISHAGLDDPRTADIEEEMAIRITTGPLLEFGSVRGQVVNEETGDPMPDVRVMIDGTGYFGTSGVNGNYRIERAPIGMQTVTAQRRYFNESSAADIEIVEGEEAVVNFSLTYPTFEIDAEEIRFGLLPDSMGQVGFTIWNEGNGPLDYQLFLNSDVDPPQRIDEWEPLFRWDVGDSLDEHRMRGVTYDGEYFYLTGVRERHVLPHPIYVLDKEGVLVGEFDQFTVDSTVSWGYTELEFNGENILAVEDENIIEITREGEHVRTIPTEYNPCQAIGWNPESETIFYKSMTGRDFYEVDSVGNILNEFYTGNEIIYSMGMTWFPADPDGFHLYIFANNRYPDEGGGTRLMLLKMNVETGEIRLVRHINWDGCEDNDRPLGCAITKLWDPLKWVFIALINSTPSDYLVGFELAPNLTWIQYEPEAGSVEPGERQPFEINFSAVDMPEREYYVELQLLHNAVGDRFDMPVYFTVGEVNLTGKNELTPAEFKFEAPYPNPFNPTTNLRFSIKQRSDVNLELMDISGRLVKSLDLGEMEPGRREYLLDASDLPSGIYFAKLNAGVNSGVRKLVMMK